MHSIIELILCLIIFRIASSQTAPELCDPSLKGQNMFDHIFNIKEDIYVTRNEWIFKLKRFTDDPKNGRMMQNGETMEIVKLFPGLKDIEFGVTLPSSYVNCNAEDDKQNCLKIVNSRGYGYVLFKHNQNQWTLYYPENGQFVSGSLDNKRFEIEVHIKHRLEYPQHLPKGSQTCAVVFNLKFQKEWIIPVKDPINCTGIIGAFWYVSNEKGEEPHYFHDQQLHRIEYPNDLEVESKWAKDHWKLLRCDGRDTDEEPSTMIDTTYIVASTGIDATIPTHETAEGQHESSDESGQSNYWWIWVIIGIIFLMAVITFIVIILSKKRPEKEVSRVKSNASIASNASNASTVSIRSKFRSNA